MLPAWLCGCTAMLHYVYAACLVVWLYRNVTLCVCCLPGCVAVPQCYIMCMLPVWLCGCTAMLHYHLFIQKLNLIQISAKGGTQHNNYFSTAEGL